MVLFLSLSLGITPGRAPGPICDCFLRDYQFFIEHYIVVLTINIIEYVYCSKSKCTPQSIWEMLCALCSLHFMSQTELIRLTYNDLFFYNCPASFLKPIISFSVYSIKRILCIFKQALKTTYSFIL